MIKSEERRVGKECKIGRASCRERVYILKGEKGPRRDIVLINSAVALYTALENKTLEECIELAAQTIDSGKALAKLQAFIEATHELSEAAI